MDLSEANLSEADLSEANLSRADLYRVDLREAILRGADLRGVIFARIVVGPGPRIDHIGANLIGTDFSQAKNLTPRQLSGTCGDELAATTLPESWKMPDGWPCRWEIDEFGEHVRVPLDPDTPSDDEPPLNPEGP